MIISIILIIILILIILAGLVAGIFSIYAAFVTQAPFVPVSGKITSQIIKALELKDGSVLYDLGCGDGRVLFAAKKFKQGVRCVGIEKAPLPLVIIKIKNIFSKNKIEVLCRDFFKTDLGEVTHIFTYLYPEVMDKLLPKFEKELRQGTRLVSCDFYFKNKEPAEVIDLGRGKHQLARKLYIYEF